MSKIFDEEYVDCVGCENYWINRCDGVSDDAERPCTAFVATRSINVPQQIKALKTQIKWLVRLIVILVILVAVTAAYLMC